MEGIFNQISIAKETTYGTEATPVLSLPVNASDGIQVNQEVIGHEAIKGTAPKNKAFFKGKQSFSGGYEMAIMPNSVGYILLSALGAVADTTVEAGAVYKHVYTEGSTRVGLTIEQKIDTIAKRFAGFVVSNIKISAKVGGLCLITFTGQAKGQADATAITKTYETLSPMNWAEITTLSIGGTDIKAKVDSIEIEYDNGLEMFYGLGSVSPATKYVKQSTCKGKIEAYVDASTDDYLASLIAGTEAELILLITGTATIGSASHTIFKVQIPKTAFNKVSTKLDFGYNALSLEFEGREDATNGLVIMELTNTTATY